MNIELESPEVGLARDGLIALRDTRGLRITCRTGVLWITQDNYDKDFIVGPGESHVIDYNGLTLVTALEPSTLSLVEAPAPLPTRLVQAFARRLAGLLPRPAPL